MSRKIYLTSIITMIIFTLFLISETFLTEKLEEKEVCFLFSVFSIVISILLIIKYIRSGYCVEGIHWCCKIAYVYNSGNNKYIVVYFQPNKKSPSGFKIKKSVLKEGNFNSLNIIDEYHNLIYGRQVDIFTNVYNEIIYINYYN